MLLDDHCYELLEALDTTVYIFNKDEQLDSYQISIPKGTLFIGSSPYKLDSSGSDDQHLVYIESKHLSRLDINLEEEIELIDYNPSLKAFSFNQRPIANYYSSYF